MFCIYWISFNCMKPSALKPYDINFIGFKGNRLGIWDRNMYISYQYRFYGFARGRFKTIWNTAYLVLLTYSGVGDGKKESCKGRHKDLCEGRVTFSPGSNKAVRVCKCAWEHGRERAKETGMVNRRGSSCYQGQIIFPPIFFFVSLRVNALTSSSDSHLQWWWLLTPHCHMSAAEGQPDVSLWVLPRRLHPHAQNRVTT